METETQLAFEGTKEEQKIAAHAFEAMKRKGMLFGANAPIKMSASSIAVALTKAGAPMAGSKPEELTRKIESALSKNEAVFAREENGDFVTTKAGRAYQASKTDTTHTFRERLNAEAVPLDADAAREYSDSLVTRAAARAERSTLMDSIISMQPPPMVSPPITHAPHPQITFETTTVIPQHLSPLPPVVEEPRVIEEERPATPATPTRPPADLPPARAGAAPTKPPTPPGPQTEEAAVEEAAPAVAEAAPVSPPTPAPVGPEATAPTEEAPAPPAQAAAPVAQPPTPPATPTRPTAPSEPAKPAAPVVTGPVEMTIQTADGPATIDLRQEPEDIMADEAVAAALMEMINAAVEEDARIVRFGSDVFPEEAVERFSKGDFRRIKDFLDEPETGGVASDRDFLDYVLNRRAEHPDYERQRFSLNYRLLKEKKDFEFVGIDTNRLWMNAGAVPVAAPKRKPAEIGQDYRFLEDPAIAGVEEEEDGVQTSEIGPIEYSLTYYEYENGVLPYDRQMKRLIPGPLMEDQRAALLQFEVPQLYTSVLAELRYPTGNRGGYIMGLAEFFAEHMVPGARFRIMPTDRADNIFEVQFDREQEQEANLLQLDDRRGRYVFRPVSFTVGTDPAMLLTQEKFGNLHNHKKLEESERKRPDTVITNALEAIGEQMDGKFWAVLDDIYTVVNIERPMSRSWLRTLLSGAYPFFYADESTEGAYFYDPGKRP